MEQFRVCKKCAEEKPISKFPSSKSKLASGEIKSYREYVCYSCKHIKEYAAGLEKDPDFRKKKREYKKEYNKNNPRAKLLWNAKSRAKKIGVNFNLTIDDIVIPEVCPLLKIELYSGDGVIIDNSPSLDRINSQVGYVKGNVWVVSHKANTMKSDATLEELELLVNNLRDYMTGVYSS